MPPIPRTGKRCGLSLEKKVQILQEVDKNRRSRTEIAKDFKIPKTSLSTIIKNKDKILAASKAGLSNSRCRTTQAKFPVMEKALLDWFKAMRQKNMPVDGNIIKAKADVFALRMNIEGFTASDGWLQRFKLRHGLLFRKLCGESGAVDLQVTNTWKENKLQRLMKDYDANDIFNADETGLFYKLLPDRSLVFKGETCSGGKRAKQRITLLLTANMTGTEKLPLFAIGKAMKPRCFKGIKTLPTKYAANKKAWMTSDLYENWLRDFDRVMLQKRRKVLLIVDNCTAHPDIQDLRAVRVEFLPPNTTSVMQPLDQGIIQAFKKFYRTKLLNRVIFSVENGKDYDIDVLGALHLAVSAWNDVSEQTIANCFRHAGFVKDSALAGGQSDSSVNQQDDDVTDEGERLFQQLQSGMEGLFPVSTNFSDYTNIDANLHCAEEMSEEQIIDKAIREAQKIQESDDNSSAEDENAELEVPAKPAVSLKQAVEAAETMRSFFEARENTEMFLAELVKFDNFLFKSAAPLKQTTISGFFSSAK